MSVSDGPGRSVSPLKKRETDRLVKLYNIDEDPTERNDVSDDFPKVTSPRRFFSDGRSTYFQIVEALLLKISDYYDQQVLPWSPADDINANPVKHGGVWKAWL